MSEKDAPTTPAAVERQEHDDFALDIAASLRQMSPSMAGYAKLKIQELVFSLMHPTFQTPHQTVNSQQVFYMAPPSALNYSSSYVSSASASYPASNESPYPPSDSYYTQT
jgi:hypothetical protein